MKKQPRPARALPRLGRTPASEPVIARREALGSGSAANALAVSGAVLTALSRRRSPVAVASFQIGLLPREADVSTAAVTVVTVTRAWPDSPRNRLLRASRRTNAGMKFGARAPRQALDGRDVPNADPLTREHLDTLLSDVEGWLALREAWELHAAVTRHPNPPTVVEIGSWKGRSTIALAAGVRQRGDGRVYAVDPHQGIRRLPELGTSWQGFVSNLRRAGVSEYVEPLRMSSDQARGHFGSRSVDVLFVDGSHVYRDVLADVDGWSPRLAPGATVAFHDWSHYPDVRRALAERVLCESPFRRPSLVDSSLFVECRPDEAWSADDAVNASTVLDEMQRIAPL